jgi:hypothetical protein
MVNRTLDYGFNWAYTQEIEVGPEDDTDNRIFQQINFFYEKDKTKKGFIKALFLHHLLDFFKETYVDIHNLDLVFKKFLQDKIISEVVNPEGKKITFHQEINEIFDLVRHYKDELFEDLNL